MSTLPVDLLLVTIAIIIIIGYLSEALFRRTKIPEVLILMFIGLIIGPITNIIPPVYASELRALTPLFGTLALILIMLNSGKLIRLTGRKIPGAYGIVIAMADVAIPGIILAFVMNWLLGWPFMYGALLGVIVGETSTITVIPIVLKLKVQKSFYDIVMTETTFNSVFAILIFYILLIYIQGGTVSAFSFTQYAISYISVAVFIGIAGGFLWLIVRNLISGAKNYLATLAIAILIYAFVDFLNGAAIVAVLIFAIILGNSRMINQYLKSDARKEREEAKDVERTLEFLVLTFFFVLIGLITLLSIQYLIYGLIVVAILVASRIPQIRLQMPKLDPKYRGLMYSLLPRGLAVAVLSSTLLGIGGTYNTEIFYICSVVLIFTNIAFAIMTSRYAKGFTSRA